MMCAADGKLCLSTYGACRIADHGQVSPVSVLSSASKTAVKDVQSSTTITTRCFYLFTHEASVYLAGLRPIYDTNTLA